MIVTLLTDFGHADTYVGQMKGAILSIAPDTQLVDLTHEVAAQDVRTGAFHLWCAAPAFPVGTIHVAVVDPGVGSARRPIAARSRRGDLFVGPDNGLLIPAIERLGGLALAVELTERAYWREKEPAPTFHGRDIFGPVGAHLTKVPLERLGKPITDPKRHVVIPLPTREGARITGEVIHVDTYGNLVTNLPIDMLPPRFTVGIKATFIPDAPHPSYQAVDPGKLCAVIGSSALLEISARDASAASLLGSTPGDRVLISG